MAQSRPQHPSPIWRNVFRPPTCVIYGVQAAGHIKFTNRSLITVLYEPSDREAALYKAMSAYLQRPNHAFGEEPNPLVPTVGRKVLGSSTVAIEGFLVRVLERLRAHLALDSEAFDDLEIGSSGGPDTSSSIEKPGTSAASNAGSLLARKADCDLDEPMSDPALAAEIAEVTAYLDLARSIGANAKGDMLVARLPGLLDEIERKGG